MFEKDATEYAIIGWDKSSDPRDVFAPRIDETKFNDWRNGAEFGYNKAKEEMQAQEYSMSYENGIFKCKYKSGKEFESIDGKTWKEIVLPKESE